METGEMYLCPNPPVVAEHPELTHKIGLVARWKRASLLRHMMPPACWRR
jgi:hypothetical protein